MYSDNVTTSDAPEGTPGIAHVSEEPTHERLDWGDMNRMLLAERLRKAYHENNSQEWYFKNYVEPTPVGDEWKAVADEALLALGVSE